MRMLKIGLLLLLAAVALAGCAAARMDRNSALDKVQYAYSAAIRSCIAATGGIAW